MFFFVEVATENVYLMVHVAGFSLKFFISNAGVSCASENRCLVSELEGTQKN
jgi:hypothetical protein